MCCFVADRAVEVDIELSNNSDHLQLRWIQDNSELNPAWAIDDIYLECDPGGLDTLLSFEEDKELGRFAGVQFG